MRGNSFIRQPVYKMLTLVRENTLRLKKQKKKTIRQCSISKCGWVLGGYLFCFVFFFLRGGGVLRGNGVCLCISMCVNKPRQFSNDLQERLYYVHTSWNSVAWRSHIRKSWMTSWAQMKTACFYILTYWVHYFVWDLHFLTIGNFPCFTL